LRRWLKLALVLALLAVGLLFFRPRALMGDTEYIIVVGRSMEPTIPRYSLAIAKDLGGYHVGDIIAYRSPYGPVVVHRIVNVTSEGFITKGDNPSATVDPWVVKEDMVLGKVLIWIPYVGLLAIYVKQPPVLAALACALALLAAWPKGKQRSTRA